MERRPSALARIACGALLCAGCAFQIDGVPPSDLMATIDLSTTCMDGVTDGSETDKDCGGPCAPCGVTQKCKVWTDCTSGVCTSGVCAAPACNDGIKNGDESDLDCGGAACPKCMLGKACNVATDCATMVCAAGKCAMDSCADQVKNGAETDVDCGGSSCPKCTAGKTCIAASDCAGAANCSGTCACKPGYYGASCAPPKNCKDLHDMDGNFPTGVATIDVDGGGAMPPLQVYCDMTSQGGGWTRLIRHVASAGYFGDDNTARSSNANNPMSDLYSILGMVDSFQRNGTWELLYWNRRTDRYIVGTQTWSPLNPATKGLCPMGGKLVTSNFVATRFCGFTPGPLGWAAINGYGVNWAEAAGQLIPYPNYPLVCTYPDGYACDWVELYVR